MADLTKATVEEVQELGNEAAFVTIGEDDEQITSILELEDAHAQIQFPELGKSEPIKVAQHSKQLVAAFGKTPGLDTAILATIAEVAKHEETREVLGASGIISCVVSNLERTGSDAGWDANSCTQCFRALANLCFDHPGNRDRVLDCKGVEAITTAIANVHAKADPDREEMCLLHVAAAGVVLNVTNDHTKIMEHAEVVGLPQIVGKLFCVAIANEMEADMAMRAVLQFQSHDGMLAEIASGGGVPWLISSLVEASGDATQDMDVVGFEGESSSDDRESAENECTLIREILREDSRLGAFADESIVADLMFLTEMRNLHFVGTAAIFISVIMGDDSCYNLIMGDQTNRDHQEKTLERFVTWINYAKTFPKNWDPPSAGAIAIGNIARTGENAAWIADKPAVLDALIELLHTDKSGFQFSALGAIKNIAILERNKKILVDAEIMAALMISLNDSQGVLQYNAASIIRSLCMKQSDDVIQKICSTEGLFDRLNHLGQQEEEAVRSEATRVFANIARFSQTPLPESFTVAIPNLITMGSSSHAILKSESLVTLIRLTKTFRQQVCDGGALKLALTIARGDQSNVEIICNALTLIGSLHDNGQQSATEETINVVTTLSTSENEQLSSQATVILAQLQ
eukprot:m.83113 g.83113  ORF g.83113 m.83113 type:complete len:633 (+) comp25596_c2_seq1:94-1992(+)